MGISEALSVAVVADCEAVVAGSVCKVFCVAFVSSVTELFCAGSNDAGVASSGIQQPISSSKYSTQACALSEVTTVHSPAFALTR